MERGARRSFRGVVMSAREVPHVHYGLIGALVASGTIGVLTSLPRSGYLGTLALMPIFLLLGWLAGKADCSDSVLT